MSKKVSQTSKNALYKALKENRGQTVDLEWLSNRTEISVSSLGTYLGRLPAIVHHVNKEKCTVNQDFVVSRGEMKRLLYQGALKHPWCHLDVSELVANLLDRSKTNASLALDIVNRPEQPNRVDAFLLLFMTAWEQLLKAQIAYQNEESIYQDNEYKPGLRRTIGMKRAVEVKYPMADNPIRKNLDILRKLRNDAAHLLVSETMSVLSFYFQASIFNYIEVFQMIAEEPPFGIESTGLLTFGVAYQAPAVEALSVRYGNRGREIRSLIEHLESQIHKNDDHRFAIPITYRLVMAPAGTPGALYLHEPSDGLDALVVERALDPKDTHPYRATEVAELLNEQEVNRPGGKWTPYHIAILAEYLGIKDSDNEYHYEFVSGKVHQHLYSDAFVDLVKNELDRDPRLVEKANEARQQS